MKKWPSIDVLRDTAAHFGVAPSFVEKDFFATQILSALSTLETPEIVFAGGTSLSKAHRLIQRFSEDLDFRILPPLEGLSRSQRRSRLLDFYSSLSFKLKEIEGISIIEEETQKRNEHRFLRVVIEHPKLHEFESSLRYDLHLEFTFEGALLPPEEKEIYSMIDLAAATTYSFKMKVLSPLETAANKYSALLWRIHKKNVGASAGKPERDPAELRHLHDLAALASFIFKRPETFVPLVLESFQEDRKRGSLL